MATERRTALPARLQSHILMSCLGSRPFQAVDAAATLCQPGRKEVAAGYVLYRSSTVFVVTTGQSVDMFVLDPMIESFVLVISLKPHLLLRTFPPETLMLPSADIW